MFVAPGGVHSVKHLAPVLCFGAAGTCMESDDCVAFIIFTGEKSCELELINILFKFFNFRKSFVIKGRIVFLKGNFDKGHCVLIAGFKIFMGIDFSVKLAELALNFCGSFNVVPKIRVFLLGFKPSYFSFALFKTEGIFKILNLGFKSNQSEFKFFKFKHYLYLRIGKSPFGHKFT